MAEALSIVASPRSMNTSNSSDFERYIRASFLWVTVTLNVESIRRVNATDGTRVERQCFLPSVMKLGIRTLSFRLRFAILAG